MMSAVTDFGGGGGGDLEEQDPDEQQPEDCDERSESRKGLR